MILIKINVQKISKERLFKGKSGTYLDAVMFENDKPDQYGNTHTIYEGLTKEERADGKKAAILGNGKMVGKGPPKRAGNDPRGQDDGVNQEDSREIPF